MHVQQSAAQGRPDAVNQPAPSLNPGIGTHARGGESGTTAPGSDAVIDSLDEDLPLAGWRSTWHALGRPGLRYAPRAGGADPLRRRARPWPGIGSARVSAPRPWSGR